MQKHELTQLNVEKVAFLLGQGGKKRVRQARIAELLDVSQATVSRLVTIARKDDLLVEEVRCSLPAKRQRELQQLIYARGLEEGLRSLGGKASTLHSTFIVDTRAGAEEKGSDDRSRFALGAAEHILSSILPEASIVGIAWGHTMQRLVECLSKLAPHGDFSTKPKEFVPICGDPPQINRNPEMSSSLLVALLDQNLNGSKVHENSLAGVAAYIPDEFEKEEEVRTLYRYFEAASAYKRVFGRNRRGGLCSKLDCIITGVGNRSDPQMPLPLQDMRLSKRELERLKKATIGNIAGVFLEKDSLTPTVQRIHERWTGIQIEDIERCAKAARAGKRAGVVVLATHGKEDVVRECLRRGLVNHLIIDGQLAAALAR